jgi:type IV fimbrial biogenesis protein FimT
MKARPRHQRFPALRQMRGLTLIELLMVLGIALAVFGFALPALSGAVEATHSSQARSALMGTYLSALTGAAVTNSHAILCPSSDGASCVNGSDWSSGWIGFIDANGDRERQPDEAIFSRQAALPGKVRLHSTAGRSRIEIQADGSSAGSNVTFTLCDGRGAARAESLVLSTRSNLRVDTPSPEAILDTCAR